jgi:MFS family permease
MNKSNAINKIRGIKPNSSYLYAAVIVAFLTFFSATTVITSFAVLFKSVSTQFDWTRAWMSGAISLSLLINGLLGIVTGKLSDKFSPQLIIIIGSTFQGLGCLLLSQMTALWQLYIYYGVLIGFGLTNLIAAYSLIAKYFGEKRGLMTGITYSGGPIGAIIIAPIATKLISIYSWRISYLIIGCLVLLLTVISAILMYGIGRSRETTCEDAITKEKPKIEVKEYSLNKLIRTGPFWILGIVFLCSSFAQQTILVHIVPHATDVGISPIQAALILSIIYIGGIISSFVIGNTIDRIGSSLSLIIALFIMLTSLLLLLLKVNDIWTFYIFAIIFGVGYGAIGILLSTVVAESFGLFSHGAIMGTLLLFMSIGGFTGPLFAGYMFDLSGQYWVAFLVAAALCVLGLILSLLLKYRVGRPRSIT